MVKFRGILIFVTNGQNILKIKIPVPEKNIQEDIINKLNEYVNFINLRKIYLAKFCKMFI